MLEPAMSVVTWMTAVLFVWCAVIVRTALRGSWRALYFLVGVSLAAVFVSVGVVLGTL